MSTSKIIRAKRTELNLSQREFAALVGVDISTVWRWEEGNSTPSRPVLSYIAGLKPDEVTP